MAQNLTDRVAVITGGAGNIGYATAIRLAQNGVRIFSLVRREVAEAQIKMDALPNSQLNHCAILADVKDTNSIKQAVDTVKTLAGRCDILINCAGVSLATKTPLDTSDEIFDEMISTNLRGTWITIREFFEMLNAQSDSIVINVSSVASVKSSQFKLAYSISKAGVNIMTECLAKTLGPNVRFVAVAPGRLTTATSGQPTNKLENLINYTQRLPLKRVPTADDVAATIESLITDIKFFNGHLLVLDGGSVL
jgi:NAD(P)-dependent dehydrogenase (short-subunit alcohol dehydrogenase family)